MNANQKPPDRNNTALLSQLRTHSDATQMDIMHLLEREDFDRHEVAMMNKESKYLASMAELLATIVYRENALRKIAAIEQECAEEAQAM